MISAEEALERLRQGNERFVAGRPSSGRSSSPVCREALVAGQEPFAGIIGCSDSRVPAEVIFDQGLGDLFVIRVAGNIITPSQLGSVEFAAQEFGTRLVMVLGHSSCGAVAATLQQVQHPTQGGSPHLNSIVDWIRPSVETVLKATPSANPEAVLAQSVRANIGAAVDSLRQESSVLEPLIAEKGLCVVGAEYSLKTGAVEVLDSVPRPI